MKQKNSWDRTRNQNTLLQDPLIFLNLDQYVPKQMQFELAI